MLDKYRKWRATRQGSLIHTGIDALFVGLFGSWAIDSGSLWHWGLTLFFFFDAVICIANIFSTQTAKKHANSRRSKKTA